METTIEKKYTYKDFESDQEVRWCPGCDDYVILRSMQKALPEMGVKREDVVFISGIGCSSRFPYYMNTYGMHSIHGRAPAIATWRKNGKSKFKCLGYNWRWRFYGHWRKSFYTCVEKKYGFKYCAYLTMKFMV